MRLYASDLKHGALIFAMGIMIHVCILFHKGGKQNEKSQTDGKRG